MSTFNKDKWTGEVDNVDIGSSLPCPGQDLNGEGAVEMGMTVEAVEGLLRSDADADAGRLQIRMRVSLRYLDGTELRRSGGRWDLGSAETSKL